MKRDNKVVLLLPFPILPPAGCLQMGKKRRRRCSEAGQGGDHRLPHLPPAGHQMDRDRLLGQVHPLGLGRQTRHRLRYPGTGAFPPVTVCQPRDSQILKKLDPKVSSIYDCSVSPDGRFITVCGFTPDVFVYEPVFKGEDGFQDCKKVFDLKVSFSVSL